MGPVHAVTHVFRNYANFTGRARRSEYWWWSLTLNLVYVVLMLLSAVVSAVASSTGPESSGGDVAAMIGLLLGLVVLVVWVASLVPGLAVSVRRLHDTNKSGWFMLLAGIPFVGGLILLVLFLLPGDPGTNAHGPDPRSQAGPEALGHAPYGHGPNPYRPDPYGKQGYAPQGYPGQGYGAPAYEYGYGTPTTAEQGLYRRPDQAGY